MPTLSDIQLGSQNTHLLNSCERSCKGVRHPKYEKVLEKIYTKIEYFLSGNISLISRDLLKQRHRKNQERFITRRFGVIVTPLSRD